jgi:CO/xanthine dehydrogenase FAD-binding subunit
MKPAPLKYHRAKTISEALSLLSDNAESAKLIAGGQSLIPMMNMRLATPEVLIDLGGIEGLNYIEERGAYLEIGALATHETVRSSPLVQRCCPLLSEAAGHIAHRQVRNRGTIGGSVAHADPAGEFPTVVTTLEAEIKIQSAEDERWARPEEFFLGYMMTTLDPAEIVTAIRFPILPAGSGVSVKEVARKENYFAIAGAVCSIQHSKGSVADLQLGIMGCTPAPLKVVAVEEMIRGRELTEALLEEASSLVSGLVEPEPDLHGSEEYRRELAGVVTKRALKEAFENSSQGENE